MSKPLPSKEQTLFRQVVQNYENKQYKKGLKVADQILKKHPDHGDTIAMKALIINSQGKSDEAFELAKTALKHAMKSHVCWHVYGLLYKTAKNYEEAIKAYKFALRLDPESAQIQRDLALLQVQMRDYPGYVQSRKAMLQQRPGFRQNWTTLAIAHHLNGELQAAENILTTFEGTLKGTPSKSDMEHAGATIYKNVIIAESGETQRALDHLETIYKQHPDRKSVMELKAKYLHELGKKEDAEKAYRKLLARNSECREYYEGLERVLGLDRSNSADRSKLLELHKSYSEKSERLDAPRRMPLDYLEGDDFKKAADEYLRRMLKKGVPSTFANVKALYAHAGKKETIQDLVLGYESEEVVNGESDQPNGNKPDLWKISVLYFLAQHYDYSLSRDLDKATSYIDKCIELNTSSTEYSYHMTKARIHKHRNEVQKASELMNEARERDLKDRYINTKCAKYQLRNNQNSDAINTMGLFTRKEATGGPLGDLLDMQCMWYLYEDGASYKRQNSLALALKRFHSIHDIFDQWQDDQFDFHSFSLRKGHINAYIEMIHWEDNLRQHPFYTRAALSAIDIYCQLADDPSLATKGANGDASEAEKKKAAKKAKKEAEKAEEEKKAAAAAKANPEGIETKKEDPDPNGVELLKTKQPLDQAMKFLTPLLELSDKDIRCQLAGFKVYIRRNKHLPALKCLVAAQKLEPDNQKLASLKQRLEKEVSAAESTLPREARDVLSEGLKELKI
ncbi:N-terminal acetyltransferase A, auxiliary subunit [Myriangium duriaei CBS 260.36]|uniref:N-terminal acetyltransferase A, auxiliary subunit n=1 Tax=Myriangium duriaei CBS 260.36 TaxID=1168546 RepID=A0A9P4IWK3_9PEZI|nr:N-terminal acetyltransferase A, auxiliary subunit [Myriangium duriaei CBS 260.36]